MNNFQTVGPILKRLRDGNTSVEECFIELKPIAHIFSHIDEHIHPNFRMAFVNLEDSKYGYGVMTTPIFDALIKLGVECRSKFYKETRLEGIFGKDLTDVYAMK